MSVFLCRFRDALSSGEAFGLGLDWRRHLLYYDFELRLEEGDVVYITEDSGSGKSVLLRALREDHVVVMKELPEPADVTLVDAVGSSFREAMGLLGRVGLNDAYLFLRRYVELSEGQRYRFSLARMLQTLSVLNQTKAYLHWARKP